MFKYLLFYCNQMNLIYLQMFNAISSHKANQLNGKVKLPAVAGYVL